MARQPRHSDQRFSKTFVEKESIPSSIHSPQIKTDKSLERKSKEAKKDVFLDQRSHQGFAQRNANLYNNQKNEMSKSFRESAKPECYNSGISIRSAQPFQNIITAQGGTTPYGLNPLLGYDPTHTADNRNNNLVPGYNRQGYHSNQINSYGGYTSALPAFDSFNYGPGNSGIAPSEYHSSRNVTNNNVGVSYAGRESSAERSSRATQQNVSQLATSSAPTRQYNYPFNTNPNNRQSDYVRRIQQLQNKIEILQLDKKANIIYSALIAELCREFHVTANSPDLELQQLKDKISAMLKQNKSMKKDLAEAGKVINQLTEELQKMRRQKCQTILQGNQPDSEYLSIKNQLDEIIEKGIPMKQLNNIKIIDSEVVRLPVPETEVKRSSSDGEAKRLQTGNHEAANNNSHSPNTQNIVYRSAIVSEHGQKNLMFRSTDLNNKGVTVMNELAIQTGNNWNNKNNAAEVASLRQHSRQAIEVLKEKQKRLILQIQELKSKNAELIESLNQHHSLNVDRDLEISKEKCLQRSYRVQVFAAPAHSSFVCDKKVQELQLQCESLRQKDKKHVDTITELQHRIDQYRISERQLLQKIHTLEEKVHSTKQRNQILEIEQKKMMEKIEELEHQMQKMNRQFQGQKIKYTLQKEQADLKIHELREYLQKKDLRIKEVEEQSKHTTDAIRQEMLSLQRRLEEVEVASEQKIHHFKKASSNKHIEEENRARQLEDQVHKQRQTTKRLESDRQNLIHELERLKIENQKQQHEHQQISHKLQDAIHQIKSAEQEKLKVETEKQDSQNFKINVLEQEVLSLTDCIQEDRKKLQQAEKYLQELKKALQMAHKEQVGYKAQLGKIKAQYNQVVQTATQLHGTIAHKQKQLEQLKKQCKSVRLQLTHATEQLNSLHLRQADATHMRAELTLAFRELLDHQHKVSEASQSSNIQHGQTVKVKGSAPVPSVGNELQIIKGEFIRLKQELANIKTELLRSQGEASNYKGELEKVRVELDKTKHELQDFRHKETSLNGELSKIKTQLTNTQYNIQTARTQLELTQKQLLTTRTQSHSYHSSLLTARSQLETSRSELETIRSEYETVNIQYITTTAQLARAASEIERLKGELASEKAMIEKLNHKLLDVNTKLTTPDPILEQKSRQIEELHSKLKQMTSQLHELQSKLTSKLDENTLLQKEKGTWLQAKKELEDQVTHLEMGQCNQKSRTEKEKVKIETGLREISEKMQNIVKAISTIQGSHHTQQHHNTLSLSQSNPSGHVELSSSFLNVHADFDVLETLEALNSKIESLHAHTQHILKQNALLVQKISHAQTENHKRVQELGSIRVELQNRMKQHQSLLEAYKTQLAEREQLQSKLSQVTQDLSTHSARDYQGLLQNNQKLSIENQKLIQQLKKIQNDFQILKREIHILSEKLVSKQYELHQVKEAQHIYLQQEQQARAHSAVDNHQFKEIVIKQAASMEADLHPILQESKDNIDRSVQHSSRLEGEKSMNKSMNGKDMYEKYYEMLTELEQLKIQNRNLAEKCSTCENQLVNLQTRLNNYAYENENLKKTNKNLQLDIAKNESKLTTTNTLSIMDTRRPEDLANTQCSKCLEASLALEKTKGQINSFKDIAINLEKENSALIRKIQIYEKHYKLDGNTSTKSEEIRKQLHNVIKQLQKNSSSSSKMSDSGQVSFVQNLQTQQPQLKQKEPNKMNYVVQIQQRPASKSTHHNHEEVGSQPQRASHSEHQKVEPNPPKSGLLGDINILNKITIDTQPKPAFLKQHTEIAPLYSPSSNFTFKKLQIDIPIQGPIYPSKELISNETLPQDPRSETLMDLHQIKTVVSKDYIQSNNLISSQNHTKKPDHINNSPAQPSPSSHVPPPSLFRKDSHTPKIPTPQKYTQATENTSNPSGRIQSSLSNNGPVYTPQPSYMSQQSVSTTSQNRYQLPPTTIFSPKVVTSTIKQKLAASNSQPQLLISYKSPKANIPVAPVQQSRCYVNPYQLGSGAAMTPIKNPRNIRQPSITDVKDTDRSRDSSRGDLCPAGCYITENMNTSRQNSVRSVAPQNPEHRPPLQSRPGTSRVGVGNGQKLLFHPIQQRPDSSANSSRASMADSQSKNNPQVFSFCARSPNTAYYQQQLNNINLQQHQSPKSSSNNYLSGPSNNTPIGSINNMNNVLEAPPPRRLTLSEIDESIIVKDRQHEITLNTGRHAILHLDEKDTSNGPGLMLYQTAHTQEKKQCCL